LSGIKAVIPDLVYLYVNKGGLITIADDIVVGEGEMGGVDAVFEQGFEAILFGGSGAMGIRDGEKWTPRACIEGFVVAHRRNGTSLNVSVLHTSSSSHPPMNVYK